MRRRSRSYDSTRAYKAMNDASINWKSDSGCNLRISTNHSCTRILVIEDRDDTRQLLEMGLKDAGFEVIAVPDGPEALCVFLSAFMANRPFHAGVFDCSMSPFDGFTVAQTS